MRQQNNSKGSTWCSMFTEEIYHCETSQSYEMSFFLHKQFITCPSADSKTKA